MNVYKKKNQVDDRSRHDVSETLLKNFWEKITLIGEGNKIETHKTLIDNRVIHKDIAHTIHIIFFGNSRSLL